MSADQDERLERLAADAFPSKGEKPNCTGHARTGYVRGYRAALESEEVRGLIDTLRVISGYHARGLTLVAADKARESLARFRGESK